MDICSKQRAAIDFCVLLGKVIGEIGALLREVCGGECFTKQTIQHWHKSFHDGRRMTRDQWFTMRLVVPIFVKMIDYRFLKKIDQFENRCQKNRLSMKSKRLLIN